MRDSLKNIAIATLAGALLGVILTSVIVPPALSWYTTPGGLPEGAQIQALVQIPEVIRYATGKLLRYQVIGGIAGAVIGLAISVIVSRRGRPSGAAVPQ
jgi:uncharacterized membrane protein